MIPIQTGYDVSGTQMQWPQQQPTVEENTGMQLEEENDTDNARRPPNAFILYTQDMRSAVRQENPSLSNTEVSSLLGKMWKEVPNETKLQYKQKAAKMQEEFKQQHPEYTYRKARRKRALNELLTKSTQGMGLQYSFPAPDGTQSFIPGYPGMFQQMPNYAGMPGLSPGAPQMQGMPQLQGQLAGQMTQQQQMQQLTSQMAQMPGAMAQVPTGMAGDLTQQMQNPQMFYYPQQQPSQ